MHVVDLALQGSGITLQFKDSSNTVVASLQLQATQLRQWLNILHEQCQQAGWPTDVWPVWVTQATPIPGTTAAVVLH